LILLLFQLMLHVERLFRLMGFVLGRNVPSIQEALFSFKAQITSLQELLLEWNEVTLTNYVAGLNMILLENPKIQVLGHIIESGT